MLLLASSGRLCGEGRVKDAVVSVLSREWPLSLKEICFLVARHHCLSVSQQAVHKALKQLVEARVLEKRDRMYHLNIEWIKEVKRFGADLEEAYQKPTRQNSTNWLKEIQPSEYKLLEGRIT